MILSVFGIHSESMCLRPCGIFHVGLKGYFSLLDLFVSSGLQQIDMFRRFVAKSAHH